MGWLLSLLRMRAVLIRSSIPIITRTSAPIPVFGVARLMPALFYLGHYVAVKLIPCVFANAYLSFSLFFLSLYIIIVYTNEVIWKRILFFVLFGLFNNFIIFVFRAAWGAEKLDTARYYVFPVVMIAFCYPFLMDIWIKHTPQIKKVPIILLVYLLCFFAVVNGGLYRYQNSDLLLKRADDHAECVCQF